MFSSSGTFHFFIVKNTQKFSQFLKEKSTNIYICLKLETLIYIFHKPEIDSSEICNANLVFNKTYIERIRILDLKISSRCNILQRIETFEKSSQKNVMCVCMRIEKYCFRSFYSLFFSFLILSTIYIHSSASIYIFQ